jgi:organic hydroperoxide reductase OsmC/OhrA
VKIGASIESRFGEQRTVLSTNGNSHAIDIPPRESGFGSSANGGELLMLALATCYCNDIYREAGKRGIRVEQVEVSAEGDFGAEGEPGTGISYRARVIAEASEEAIRELIEQTDRIAEIHNTLRIGTPVALSTFDAVSVSTPTSTTPSTTTS